jgi:uncharacterized protein (UPF0210 family)
VVTDWSRRDVLSAVAAGLAAAELPRMSGAATANSAAALTPKDPASHPVRIRTMTAGVTVSGPDDIGPINRALERLLRIRKQAQGAGYEVQTIRVATTPLAAGLDADGRRRALSALEKLDGTIAAADALLSIGPILPADSFDPQLGVWAAELAQRTQRTSFSVTVASREGGVHRSAIRSAAAVIDALSRVHPSGSANFNFAAAACVEPGTPFFPVAYHQGPDSLALGLESAGLLHAAFEGGVDADDAADRLRQAMEATLSPIDTLGSQWAGMEQLRYLGIDTSPAPGLDRSIGGAIEAMTGRPFGQLSTLQACASITAVLKSLSVRTCGYCGLMLPVLEDPVLAQRAAERRYGIQELLLYSTVCGTGLDVVPIPGDAGVDAMARIIADVATLAFRLHKPLSARLFPVPGKRSGDTVSFDDPRLTKTRVFDIG